VSSGESLERWPPILSRPGYGVSDAGRVYSWKRGRCLVVTEGNRYLQVRLGSSGGVVGVARLVLEAFVRGAVDGEHASYRDGDYRNVRLENLKWETWHETNERARLKGLLGPRVVRGRMFARATDPTWEDGVYG
jgi:hypothetical protein